MAQNKKSRTLSGAPAVKTKTDRAAAATQRELMRQAREKEEKEARIRRWLGFGTLGVIVVALAVLVVAVVAPALNRKSPTAGSYGLTIGSDSAPVTLDIYQDFMCPYCGKFERAQADDLKSLIDSGKVKAVYHLMNFLDPSSSGTSYSTRAANAFATVAKQQPSAALAFDSALYANQPAEGSTGLTDAQIADLARSAGVSDAIVGSFTNKPNVDFVNKSNQAAFADGITSTPTVKINGTVWKGDLYTPGTLKAAVEAAK